MSSVTKFLLLFLLSRGSSRDLCARAAGGRLGREGTEILRCFCPFFPSVHRTFFRLSFLTCGLFCSYINDIDSDIHSQSTSPLLFSIRRLRIMILPRRSITLSSGSWRLGQPEVSAPRRTIFPFKPAVAARRRRLITP